MSAPDDFKTQVLAATDIVDLIGQSVALKRRGRKFLGLCPFHQEKSPSFNVDSVKQFYYCFGCKQHGNAIDFVIKRDRVEFIEALKLLATKAGIEMPRLGVSKEKQSERQVLLEAHSAACSFFEKMFADPEIGKSARDYVQKRGFSREILVQFQIGLSLEGWDGLMRSPLMKKFPVGMLHQAGLVKGKEADNGQIERYYDTFRNRLMFPIRDDSGRIIAFGGRKRRDEDEPKYLNSPETPLFSKSRSIFGLDLAKQRIVETRTAVIVEGYTDVLMAHQFGMTNVVSILGTAMTDQHLALLRRFADKIVLLFDSDSAGATAADRALELVVQNDVQLGIATLPEGLDPDEFLLKEGAASFEALIKAAPDAIDFKSQLLFPKLIEGGGTVETQTEAFNEIVRLFASFRTTTEQQKAKLQSMLKMFSKRSGIEEKVLLDAIRATQRRVFRPATESTRPVEPTNKVRLSAAQMTAEDRAQRWVLAILLSEPSRWQKVQQHLHPEDFADPACQNLAQVYWNHQRDEGEPVFNEFLGNLKEESVAELAVELLDDVELLSDPGQTLEECVGYLVQVMRQRQEQSKLVAEIRRTTDDKRTDADEIALLRKIQEKARRPDVAGRA